MPQMKQVTFVHSLVLETPQAIRRMIIDPSKTMLITATNDGTISIFDIGPHTKVARVAIPKLIPHRSTMRR
jgi:hypothetical protein